MGSKTREPNRLCSDRRTRKHWQCIEVMPALHTNIATSFSLLLSSAVSSLKVGATCITLRAENNLSFHTTALGCCHAEPSLQPPIWVTAACTTTHLMHESQPTVRDCTLHPLELLSCPSSTDDDLHFYSPIHIHHPSLAQSSRRRTRMTRNGRLINYLHDIARVAPESRSAQLISMLHQARVI